MTPEPGQVVVGVTYAVVVVAVTAEVAWLARGPRGAEVLRSARTASAMAGGALVVGIAYTAVLRVLWNGVATVRWEAAADGWHHHPLTAGIATFVAWDLSGWLYHLVGHRTRVGWAAHQVHHTGDAYDLTLGLRQTWAPFHGLWHQPLLALAGFDLRTVFICAALSNCWQVLEHTSLPVRLPGWAAAHVMTPGAHRHHHGAGGRLVNLGPVLTWWDRLAGTWVPAEEPAPLAYGQVSGRGALSIELAGWRALVPSRRVTALPGSRP